MGTQNAIDVRKCRKAVVLTQTELAALRAAVKADEQPLGQWCRNMLLKAAEPAIKRSMLSRIAQQVLQPQGNH
jgi:hypothetical protein